MPAKLPTALLATTITLVAAAAGAQIHYQPQPPPLVTAESAEWFRLGEPITFEGNFYYPAGVRVYFNGNTMVRTGAYRGVPLYADATIEPYSKVFVPLAGGLLQPYERRRAGDVAGSTGSHAPSFPVTIAGESSPEPGARPSLGAMQGPPVFSQPDELAFEARLSDAAAAHRAASGVSTIGGATASPASTSAAVGTTPPQRHVLEAGAKPKGLNEIYVTYAGYRWKSAGMAVPMDEARYEAIGEYAGHRVYAVRGRGVDANRIYLPSRAGLVAAPYERSGKPIAY